MNYLNMGCGTKVALILCTIGVLLGQTTAYRILCFFPSSGRSHVLVGQALLTGLAERGHQVTMVSPFKLSKPVDNYREIVVQKENIDDLARDYLQKGPSNFFSTMPVLFDSQLRAAENALNSPAFVPLLNEQFDLVIVGYFVADFVLGLGPHFNAPTAVLFSAGITKLTADFVGNPTAVSTVPHTMLGTQGTMSFMERFKNMLFGVIEILITHYVMYLQKPFYERSFPSSRYPSYEDVRKNVSLVLLNSHFSQTTPRPYLPNMIEVGGLQIKQKPSPLPGDIKEWLDGAEHGVIYFCLGSNLKSADLPDDKLQAILGTFAKLKQRVLWKWEADSVPDLPQNVLTKQWLPQDDVLAHKNVKLFVSHGGLGGIAEAKYHGVPVLGIPIFGDQLPNIQVLVKEGLGLMIDYVEMSETSLLEAIKTMIETPTFMEKAKLVSSLYRDRPQGAMDLACYWIEYVIRYGGAPHLHYPGADQNIVQRLSLDVVAIWLLILYALYRVARFLISFLLRMCCSRKNKPTDGGRVKKRN